MVLSVSSVECGRRPLVSRHACSFVLFDTTSRATVIGFEREDAADSFRSEFVG